MIASSVLMTTFVSCIVAFLLCGVPFGLIIASIAGHVDIRSVGSGNIGTTNVGREVGKGAAAAGSGRLLGRQHGKQHRREVCCHCVLAQSGWLSRCCPRCRLHMRRRRRRRCAWTRPLNCSWRSTPSPPCGAVR